jgi:protein-disulfide isomerase
MLIHDFLNTGKVRFLFKDFPISDIPPSNSATLASMASYCAADQGNIGNIMINYMRIPEETTADELIKNH